jgi:transcriptional regulator with XRE-family HTH domain
VARLSGVSRDYLKQLEQSRAGAPSAQVLRALAATLRLSPAETHHLFRLARQPAPSSGTLPETMPSRLPAVINRLDAVPAAIYDPCWNLVCWNSRWPTMHGEPGTERNLAVKQFTGLPTRVRRTERQAATYEESLVADLRASSSRYPNDCDLAALIRHLRRSSGRFDRLWRAGTVGSYEGEQVIVDHPAIGRLRVDCDVLTIRDSDYRIVVCTTTPGGLDQIHRLAGTADLAGSAAADSGSVQQRV